MLVGQTQVEGMYPVLRFYEGLELEVVAWVQEVDGAGVHRITTHAGVKLASFEENGAVAVLKEQTGSGVSDTLVLVDREFSGAGLPFTDAKRLAMAEAAARAAERAAAAEASATPPPDPEPEGGATPPDGESGGGGGR